MRKTISILFTFLLSSIIAQPTFTATDLNPLAGEFTSSYVVDTNGVSEGLSGPNQNWVYNLTYNASSLSIRNVINTSGIPVSAVFPTANIITATPSTTNLVYRFYNAQPNYFEYFGGADTSATGIDSVLYSNPLTIFKYPLTYQNTFFDTAIYSNISISSPNTNIDERKTIADAYGDLTINGQVYNNVLRLYVLDSIYRLVGGNKVLVLETKFYGWYKIGYKTPIMSISYLKTISTNSIVKSAFVNGSLFTTQPNANNFNLIISPNPVEDYIQVSGHKTDYEYRIFGLSGKRMISGTLDFKANTISVSNLEPGLYVLEMKSNNKTLVKKFVKGP
jgi:Secretion system C-terminal sorting domain